MATVKYVEGVIVSGETEFEKENTISLYGPSEECIVMGGNKADKITAYRDSNGYMIYTGYGNDTIITQNGSEVFSIDAGDGNNVISNTGAVTTYIAAGDGNNKIEVNGHVGGIIEVGTGTNIISIMDDVYNNTREEYAVTSGDGNDTIKVYNFISDGPDGMCTVDGSINAGHGDNAITVDGTVNGRIETGKGNDKITVGKHGAVYGDIEANDGNNTVTVNNLVGGNITLGYGNDKVTIAKNAEVSGDISSNDGNKTFTVSGKVGAISAGAGKNVITVNAAAEAGDIYLGEGVNTININGGSRVNYIEAYGTNTINVDGYVSAGINLKDDGNNKITLKKNSGVDVISTGYGNDTIIVAAGATTSEIYSYGGNNIVKLTGGANSIELDGIGSNKVTVGKSTSAMEFISVSDAAEGMTNTINITGREVEAIYGGSGNDNITTTGTFDTIVTGEGKNKVTVDFKVDKNFTIDTTGSYDTAVTIKNAKASNFSVKAVDGGVMLYNEHYPEQAITLLGEDDELNATTIKFTDGVKTFGYFVERATGLFRGSDVADKMIVMTGDKLVETGKGNDVVTINGYHKTEAQEEKLQVNLQGGNNTVKVGVTVVNGETFVSEDVQVNTGEGKDKILANKAHGIVVEGGDKVGVNFDTVTLTNVVDAEVTTKGGADKVTLTNVNEANVATGEGVDVITVSGSENITLDSGVGADKISINWKNSDNIKILINEDKADTITFKNIKLSALTMEYSVSDDTLTFMDANGKEMKLVGWNDKWNEAEKQIGKKLVFSDGAKTWAQVNALANIESGVNSVMGAMLTFSDSEIGFVPAATFSYDDNKLQITGSN